jgi:histidinol-phosphatase (PHP family)
MLVDYHCHTNFSSDSHALMSDQCRAAIHKGVRQIAFTEHEDYNPRDTTSFFFKHAEYMKELARCREQFGSELTIRAGIEVSEPHLHAARAAEVLARHDWDFVLGSLHWIGDGEINTFEDQFWLYRGDWRQSLRDYFTEMIALARDGDFDILSHIDYPARYGAKHYREEYDIGEYEDIVREVLRHVIARGKGIEINTSPWRRGLPNPNPPAAVVKWYRDMGGEILTLGSDSHAPKDVGAGIERAMDIARAAGFTRIAVFEQRKAIFVEIGNL